MGLLTFLLHRLLGWQTGWAGPLLLAAFHLALCATLPYMDPIGLTAKGMVHEQFLRRHQRMFLGFGALSGLGAVIAAASQGWWVLGGTAALGALAIVYQRRRYPKAFQRIPALKDLSQALVPALLAVGFPWFQGFHADSTHVLAAFLILFFCALAIHGLRHLQAFGEDRILGREILPVAIGSRATKWLAMALIIVSLGGFGWMVQSGF